MIHHLNGKLIEKNPSYAIIECNGVGYFVNISIHTFSQISDRENIRLFTQLIVREDAQILYGFYTSDERQIFNLLISVSGVGVASGRMILSTLTPESTIKAIVQEDADTLKSVKGIGAKTAQRIILDLKDKVNSILELEELSLTSSNINVNRQEALSALEVLGISKKIAEKKLDVLLKENANFSVEELVKNTLKKI